MTEQDVIRVRRMEAADKNFILNSWLKSYRNSPAVDRMENPSYFHEQSKVINDLLDNCPVLVASDPKDPSNIFGYLVYQFIEGTFVLHYIYVKQVFRNKGVGKYLIAKAGHQVGEAVAIYTHHTKAALKIAYKFRFILNPFILGYFKFYLNRERQDETAAS